MGNNDRRMRVLPGRSRERAPTINPALARDLTPQEEPKTPEQLVAGHPDPALPAFGVCQQLSGMLARDEVEVSTVLAYLAPEAPEREKVLALQERLKAERKRLMIAYTRAFMLSTERRGLGENNLAAAEATVAAAETEIQKRAAAKASEAPKETTP